MELNRPITEEDHKVADEKYRSVIESQKTYIHQIAGKLEAGESLEDLEVRFAVAVLRGAAKGMKTERPRPAGRPSQLPGELAYLVGFRMLGGESQNKAMEYYAGDYEVSLTSVKNELKKQNFKDILKDMKTWVRK